MEKRPSGAGIGRVKPVLNHTSRTGVVIDNAAGKFTECANKVWNDASDEIKSIDERKPHRVDLM